MERRSGRDRRQNQSIFHPRFLFKGKRHSLRRTEDTKRVTVFDQYHPVLLFYVLVGLLLSLLDAALTLVLLSNGAVELNPVMQFYIDLGPWPFFMVKYAITALALLLIVVFSAMSSVRHPVASSLMLPCCVSLFGAVVFWELYLLAQ